MHGRSSNGVIAIISAPLALRKPHATYDGVDMLWRGKMKAYIASPPMSRTSGSTPSTTALLRVVDGQLLNRSELLWAAERGQLRAVQWLGESGCCGAITSREYDNGHPAPLLVPELFAAAALSGSEPLLQWLASAGCPMDGTAWVTAVTYGSEAQLQLLQRLGCPMPVG